MYRTGYLSATQHPWPCLIFLIPLLLAYEGGIWWLGGQQPEVLRNGAHTWLHWGLEAFGLSQLFWAPILIGLLFLLWSWLRWFDRPDKVLTVCTAMAVESVVFAFGLLSLSRFLGPALQGIIVSSYPSAHDKSLSQVVTFVGAGIYEEVLFRLLIFGGGIRLLRILAVPGFLAVLVAAAGSSLLFSAAHHAGPSGEVYNEYVFWFRTLAGLYFTAVYQIRGFGIAVGAHACYDVLAGVMIG